MTRALRLLVATLALQSVPACASVITFDDLDASSGDVVLAEYHGFAWTDFSVYANVPGFPGFNNGIVSGPNAAYSSRQGVIASSTSFDVSSLSVGAGYYDNLALTFLGLVGGTQYYSQTVTVGTAGAQSLILDFNGIDRLVFSAATMPSTTDRYNCGAVGCTYFTLDNINLSPSSNTPTPPPTPPTPPTTASPEPATCAMLVVGAVTLFSLRRYRRSAQ